MSQAFLLYDSVTIVSRDQPQLVLDDENPNALFAEESPDHRLTG
jgi:hypothetical protein